MQEVDSVIVTTSPPRGGFLKSQRLLHQLEKAGTLQLDPTGLGIAYNDHAKATNHFIPAGATMLIAGPLAWGTFGELMGLPQVSENALYVQGEIRRKPEFDAWHVWAGRKC